MLEHIKKTLWVTADNLRINVDAAEYKNLVLGMIFAKYLLPPPGRDGRPWVRHGGVVIDG